MLRRESLAVLLHGLDGQLRRDEVGVGVRKSEAGGVRGGVVARTEHPHLRCGCGLGRGLEILERLGDGRAAGDERDKVLDLGRVVLDAEWIAVCQRRRGETVATRSPADAQVDPARVEHLQHAEVLRHLERRIVGQHHAAGSDANPLGLGRQPGDQDLGRRTRERVGSVVFGHPVAMVAEFIAALGERHGVRDGVCRHLAAGNGRLIENAEFDGQDAVPRTRLVAKEPV